MDGLLNIAERHKRTLTIVGWTCFAIGCAIHARFIDLPDWAAIPFWVGVAGTTLRWSVLEPMRQKRLARRDDA